MSHGPSHPDVFEGALARSLEAYAARVVPNEDAYTIVDRMLEMRRRRRVRIAIGGAAGVLATAIVVSVAVGGWINPAARTGEEGVSPLPSAAAEASQAAEPTAMAPASSATGPSSTTVAGEAPAACGFPARTPLEFAGRSTTAELDVQEVVGDPMSDDPADIYITRDPLPYGDRTGRLVCAVFVGSEFVEITVHPEDGGRVEPKPSPDGTTSPSPPAGITRQEAIATALQSLDDDAASWEVVSVRARALGDLEPFWEDDGWPPGVTVQRWVWHVFLVSGDRGAGVTVDFVDGAVLRIQRSIVN